MADTLDTCGDGCGWIAGIVAALAYGSFGVPVRHTKHIQVHPLVLQSFKTATMFVFSWGVVFLGVTPSWTSWGLVSGFLWVIGGTGGILAIRLAGLAIAVGTWASVMVLMNFIWGILVFQEPINDVGGTVMAFLLLTLGLVGMSFYASPSSQKESNNDAGGGDDDVLPTLTETERAMIPSPAHNGDDEALANYSNMDDQQQQSQQIPESENNSQDAIIFAASVTSSTSSFALNWNGIRLTQRQAGIAGAVFNGIMTGSSLIPLHYAKQHGYGGANFMLSMAGGALISNILLWIVMYFYHCRKIMTTTHRQQKEALQETRSSPNPSSVSSLTTSDDSTAVTQFDWSQSVPRRAYDSMPVWHFNELTIPGIAAGILLSVAMFGSILSVTYLGQGVGNSIVQTKILVSGLWGILLFREVRGLGVIAKWFLSAILTVLGIVWLSYERILATEGQGGGH